MINHSFLNERRKKIREKNNEMGKFRSKWIKRNPYFYKQLLKTLKFVIEENAKILHIRCGNGFILNELNPKIGIGIDDSETLIQQAKSDYTHLQFFDHNSESSLPFSQMFDYILISSIEDIVDVESVLENVKNHAHAHTRIVIINYNFLWTPLVKFAEKIRIKMPLKQHNWITDNDLNTFLQLSNYDIVTRKKIILIPYNIPIFSWIFNRFLARLPLVKHFGLMTITTTRPLFDESPQEYSVSVIIPCKNEAGNIEDAVKRVPEMGKHTEIIFCDDKSTDGTPEIVREMMKKYPQRDIKLYDGPGISKSENVWVGFDQAQGDILMILDADLTVIPEELPYFYQAISKRRGEYINGSRLVYPMHNKAMKLFNIFGNKFFSIFFSYILDSSIKDTLCGTKVLWRLDYQRIKTIRHSWGVRDRWGDYELIFGANKFNLKHLDLPVHYYERTYGETKMTGVLKNGWIMLKMSFAALFKIKFH